MYTKIDNTNSYSTSLSADKSEIKNKTEPVIKNDKINKSIELKTKNVNKEDLVDIKANILDKLKSNHELQLDSNIKENKEKSSNCIK